MKDAKETANIIPSKKITSLSELQTSLSSVSTMTEKDAIWASVQNPLISEQADGTYNLTFLYRGDSTTQSLSLCSAIIDPYMSGEPFHKIDDTDIWHLTVKNVSNDARITYLYLEKEWGGLLNLSSDFSEKEPQYKDVCSLFDSPVCTILCRDALYYADNENKRLNKIILKDGDSADDFLRLKNIISNQPPGVIQLADEKTDKLITSVTHPERYAKPTHDPLNSYKIEPLYEAGGVQYIAELPHAKPQPYVNREILSDTMKQIRAENRLIEKEIDFSQSEDLCNRDPYKADSRIEGLSEEQREFRKVTQQGETRKYWVHLPPSYDPNPETPYKVLVHLDGAETIKSMQLPAIMEAAPVEVKPTITIYVDQGNRGIEYGCGKDAELFADFLAKKFLPDLWDNFPGMSKKPEDTTIAGFSMGGNAATQIGTRHPERFGNVISQSGAFWMGGPDPVSDKLFNPTEGLLTKLEHQNYANNSANPNNEHEKKQCFYLNAGKLETGLTALTPDGQLLQSPDGVALLTANRNFEKFLQSKGVACKLEEYSGDHCFAQWQNDLVDGLIKTRQMHSDMTMTIAQKFIKNLQDDVVKKSLPEKFWADYSSGDHTPTFQNVLDKYAEYYNNESLSAAQKDEISKIFWEQVKDLGTPIIEKKSDGQSEVYFLFPRDKLLDEKENPGTKKELYLQGDFHGYGSTLDKTQKLAQLPGTDVMYRSNTMPKDALVTYYYVQLDSEHGNKAATHFYGDVAYQPPSFFPVKPGVLPADKPPEKTREELEAASALFFGSGSVLKDEFSKYHKIYDPQSSFFCADPDKDISYLRLPIEDKAGSNLGKFFSDLEKKARVSLVSVDEQVAAPSNLADLSKISRSIQVFAPPGDSDIEQVVIINDGKYYQLGNTVERLDKLLSKNTAVIFITPEQGIEDEAIKKGVKFEPADTLPGMGARTVDLKYRVDEYAAFIHNKLLPALVDRGIKIPTDPEKIVLVGSSLSGTASIYMGITYPKWFGKVVAQSPSINNRGKLEKIIAEGKKPPPPEIFLSCGEFESPKYAKNLNIPFAEELAKRLGIELHRYYHGHQMEGWSAQLEESLPALGLGIEASRTLNTTAILTSVKSTEIRPPYEIQHADVTTAKTGAEDSRQTQTLSPEVAREIRQRYRGALENFKIDAPASTAAIEGDVAAEEEHRTPSPFQITPKPSGE